MKRNNFLCKQDYMIILKNKYSSYKHQNRYELDFHLRVINYWDKIFTD